jgi:hypothetical protein
MSFRLAIPGGLLSSSARFPLRQPRRIVRETVNQGKNFLSGQPNGRSVKDFHLPSQAANPLAGFDPTTYGRF